MKMNFEVKTMDYTEYSNAARRAYQAKSAANMRRPEQLANWSQFGQGGYGRVAPQEFHPQQNATLADLLMMRDQVRPTMYPAAREQDPRLRQQQYQQVAQSEYEHPAFREGGKYARDQISQPYAERQESEVDRYAHAQAGQPYYDEDPDYRPGDKNARAQSSRPYFDQRLGYVVY